MRVIDIIVGHPTQFEGPFYRYVAEATELSLRVVFLDASRMARVYDAELGASLDWGINLLEGYSYAIAPPSWRAWWLIRHVVTHPTDLLVLNGYNSPALLAALVAARLRGQKTALRLDSVANPSQSGFRRLAKRWLLPFLFRGYDAFLCTGSRSRAYLRDLGVADERIFYQTYAVDQAWFAAGAALSPEAKQQLKLSLGLPEDKPIILAVAKFSQRETPWDLLKALPYLTTGSVCLLVGEGPERGLIEAWLQTQPGLTVRLPGYVHYPELPGIYGLADVFVHAAQDEPYGVSVAEALACGLPVITSDRVGAAYDLLEAGVNGGIYPLGDVRALANLLDDWLHHGMSADAQRRSQAILSRWNYQSTAAELQRCAQSVHQSAPPL